MISPHCVNKRLEKAKQEYIKHKKFGENNDDELLI
jgi:hypothetical protein